MKRSLLKRTSHGESKDTLDSEVTATRRLEALTDGVFAIAMTLLVLDLKITGADNLLTSSQLLSVMNDQLAGFPSFVISFLLLGSMWAVHSRQFEYITKTDRHLTMINNIRLLVVVLIPLTTSMAGNYQSLVLGRILLPLNFLILALVSYWQWSYAVDPKHNLTDNRLTKGLLRSSELRNKAIIYSSVVVVIASVFVGEIAFVLLTFSGLVEKLLTRRR